MEDKFILMIDTLCQGPVVGCWSEENGVDAPCLFDTEEEAYKDIADDMITVLQQFIDGERSLEDTDFGTELYVVPVKVLEDGVITTKEDNVLFDPKIGRI